MTDFCTPSLVHSKHGNNYVRKCFFLLFQKSYARSDEHLTEIFKDVCDSMMDYGLQQVAGGKLTVFRTRSRSGEEIFNRNVGFNDNIRQTFKNYVRKQEVTLLL